jgi:hypothetical protein
MSRKGNFLLLAILRLGSNGRRVREDHYLYGRVVQSWSLSSIRACLMLIGYPCCAPRRYRLWQNAHCGRLRLMRRDRSSPYRFAVLRA